jgi:hypothetical protein
MQGWFNISKAMNMIQHINSIKSKNHILTSVYAKKAFDKITHTFMKSRGNWVNASTKQRLYMTNIQPMLYLMGKTKSIYSKIRNTLRVSILTTLIQYSAWILSQNKKGIERNKGIKIGKIEVKLSLCTDDMNVYLIHHKDSIRML